MMTEGSVIVVSRIEKRIDKLTSRLFLVPLEERPYLTKRIEKLRRKLKEKNQPRAVRVPAALLRHRQKFVL